MEDKQRKRHSWGPDDTWSGMFKCQQERESCLDEMKADEKATKSRGSSIRRRRLSKSSNVKPTTDIELKSKQPMRGYDKRGNAKQKRNFDTRPFSVCYSTYEKLRMIWQENEIINQSYEEFRRRELMKMAAWCCEEGADYVNTETVQNVAEAEVLLDIMLASCVPVHLSFKVNSPSDITITYQFLHTFKHEYMVLKISKTHCMVMRAF